MDIVQLFNMIKLIIVINCLLFIDEQHSKIPPETKWNDEISNFNSLFRIWNFLNKKNDNKKLKSDINWLINYPTNESF